MTLVQHKYCLDTNILIQAWQKYYSPKYCQQYWDILNRLGTTMKVFIPEEVYDEINRTDDDLLAWLKSSNIQVRSTNSSVTQCLSNIYAADPLHKSLVDNTRARSLADPWVIAHAMDAGATVVTKEELVTAANSRRVKIPNICANMNIRCIDDFQMIEELNIQFSCKM